MQDNLQFPALIDLHFAISSFIDVNLSFSNYDKKFILNTFRKIPPVCLIISIVNLLTGRLRFPQKYIGSSVKMNNGEGYKIFRHVEKFSRNSDGSDCVFIVSFKFRRLSHKTNRLVSILPMLIIAGYPGFVKKFYAVNPENGFWQGMYQWKSEKHLEEYKKSLVFNTMNKRALPESINSFDINGKQLVTFIDENLFINVKAK